METPVSLRPFTKEDLAEFIRRSMDTYWEENNLEAPPNPLFPLTEKDVDEAFAKSKGVPREAIRQVIARFDRLITGKAAPVREEQADYVIKLTPAIVISAISSALSAVGTELGVEVQLGAAVVWIKDPVHSHLQPVERRNQTPLGRGRPHCEELE